MWLLHFIDSEPLTVWLTPAATLHDVRSLYPAAIVATPQPTQTEAHAADPRQEAEIRALISAIYCYDKEPDRREALAASLSDPEAALVCYRTIVAGRPAE